MVNLFLCPYVPPAFVSVRPLPVRVSTSVCERSEQSCERSELASHTTNTTHTTTHHHLNFILHLGHKSQLTLLLPNLVFNVF